MNSALRKRLVAVLAASLVVCGLTSPGARAADYGRIAGTISDAEGNPLMGATVIVIGPVLASLRPLEAAAQRVITDAHGKFAVERLIPGWYSLQVISATRIPVLKNRLRVEADRTLRESIVLADILTPIRFKVPSGNVSSMGEDWKWVLRTSADTRPVLRYKQPTKGEKKSRKDKSALPPSQHLIAMGPGSASRAGLSEDPGMGSVLAYLRPLSENSDLLVAGSMGADGLQASSVATVLRRDVLKGGPQELALVVHQLSFAEGLPMAMGGGRETLERGQALLLSYAQTRRLLDSLVLTTGMELAYLNAGKDAVTTRPHVKLQYQMTRSNLVTVRYGSLRGEGDGSLVDRVGTLTALPRITMSGYRPRLEKMSHAEVSFARAVGANARLEVAAFRDSFENTAVWGFGRAESLEGMAGNFLPNPAANGITLNAGRYASKGVRAVVTRNVGRNVQATILYSLGDALAMSPSDAAAGKRLEDIRQVLRPRGTQSVAGKVSARVPGSRTQIVTSYQWLPSGRVTGVDPAGQMAMQIQPFLGLQIRQPLPNLAFLPARIEALADFRNLLGQGYISASRVGDEVLKLTPVYRSFRGGFSVQF